MLYSNHIKHGTFKLLLFSSTVWLLLDGWSLNTAACVAVEVGQDPLSYSPLILILQGEKKCITIGGE